MLSYKNNVIAGLQWGYEGKESVADFFAERSAVSVRFQGASTGGHAITAGGRSFVLNYLPCAVHLDKKLCVVTQGVVIDLEKISQEIESLKALGMLRSKLMISPRCPLILDYHRLLDVLDGRQIGGEELNRTMERRGYGRALMDDLRRLGIRAGDLLDSARLRERLELNLRLKNEYLEKIHGERPFDPDKLFSKIMGEGESLAPYIAPVEDAVADAAESGKGVLFEGSGGTMCDLGSGMYPYISPGSSVAPAVFMHSGLKHRVPLRIIGAVKAYSVKNGPGPFVTEERSAVSAFIRTRGGEFDLVSGAPRRIGWLDLPALKYAADINGADMIVITSLDVLTGIDELKICTSYKINGRHCSNGGISAGEAEAAEAVYESIAGWHEDLPVSSDFNLLPVEAQRYIHIVEDYIGRRVIWTGQGTQWHSAFEED